MQRMVQRTMKKEACMSCKCESSQQRASAYTDFIACFPSIQLPHSEMALSFKGNYSKAPVSSSVLNCRLFFFLRNRIPQLFLTKERNDMSTYWRLSPAPAPKQQVVKNPPISTTEIVQRGAVTTTMITTTSVTTTTRTVTRMVAEDA